MFLARPTTVSINRGRERRGGLLDVVCLGQKQEVCSHFSRSMSPCVSPRCKSCDLERVAR